MLQRFKRRRSREGGNPVAYVVKSLDPRLRGDDDSTYLIAGSIEVPQYQALELARRFRHFKPARRASARVWQFYADRV